MNEPIYTNRLFWLQCRLSIMSSVLPYLKAEGIRVMQQALDGIEIELTNLNK